MTAVCYFADYRNTFRVFLNNSASLSSSGLQFHVLCERKNKPNAEPPISMADRTAFHKPPEYKSIAENASNSQLSTKGYFMYTNRYQKKPYH